MIEAVGPVPPWCAPDPAALGRQVAMHPRLPAARRANREASPIDYYHSAVALGIFSSHCYTVNPTEVEFILWLIVVMAYDRHATCL